MESNVTLSRVSSPILRSLSSLPLPNYMHLCVQEKAGCKMQMIQDGQYANSPEKPLRMTGLPESCKVRTTLVVLMLRRLVWLPALIVSWLSPLSLYLSLSPKLNYLCAHIFHKN